MTPLFSDIVGFLEILMLCLKIFGLFLLMVLNSIGKS